MPIYYFNKDQMAYIRDLLEEELRKERMKPKKDYDKLGKLRLLVRFAENPSKLYKSDGKGNFIRQKTY